MKDKGKWVALVVAFASVVALLLGLLMLAPVIQPPKADTPAGGATATFCGSGKMTVPDKAKPWAAEAAKTSGLPAAYLAAIMQQESGFDPGNFTGDSNGGTWGLFQINREEWHIIYPQGDNPGGTPKGITDPMVHAHYGGLYLKNRLATVTKMQKAHPTAAYAKLPPLDALVIAHNAGEGNLMRYPNIPGITQNYLKDIHQWFTGAPCPAATGAAAGSSGQTGKDDYSAFMREHGFTPADSSYVVDIYDFYYGECTGYAAFSVAHYSKYKDFTNNWRGQHFGYAKEWGAAARGAGITVNTTPAVGAVAERLSGSSGHVAYVTAVHPDGSFDINEANWATHHGFGSRTNLHVGSDFDQFLHFEK